MIAFAFTMTYAGLMDLTTMKIRNSLVLGLLAAYSILAPLAGFSIADIGWSVVVAAGVLLVTFIFFSRGWMGGGDAKLASVAALWIGADQTATFLVYTALLGGALTLAILQFRMLVLPAFVQDRRWIVTLQSPQSGIPYGVAIAAAALTVFPKTSWMSDVLGLHAQL